jgi:hypothetical protein
MSIQSTLLFSTFFAVVSAAIYGYVGWRLGKRVIPSSDARLAWMAFTIWWYGLAATTLIGAVQNLFGALGLTSLPLFITAGYINVLASSIALCGLVYYLTYLFTGSRRSLLPLVVFYFIFYALVVYYTAASIPEAVEVGRWSTSLTFQTDLPSPVFALIAVMLLLPQILGGIAYFTLYFRVPEKTQKYRILLVSWSIIIWFVSPSLAFFGNVTQHDWWQLTSRFIGLAAALTILMAYLPPPWIKQRYGILSLSDESQQA